MVLDLNNHLNLLSMIFELFLPYQNFGIVSLELGYTQGNYRRYIRSRRNELGWKRFNRRFKGRKKIN
jgi:hypothetical protein